ncbi:putative major facilitator superfamily transporter [Microthyrium microscopicum]|uniref:Putative major facilitator superfamily transporter n=1 Tax=Microthyrium microscopicum TaxID=703497 RepID=A0A6A6UJR7_9PEZI|nr:putative major facilitator superfamily transporter [Microthyrium microscopicum]
MSHQPHDSAGEHEALLSSQRTSRPTVESQHSYSSFRDVTQPELSSSVASLPSVSSVSSDNASISKLRGWGIVASLGLLIFLQASNISLLTTTQGVIAEDLDAFEEASWFTSAYLVATASVAPVSGKLSYIVTPRICMFVSTIFLSLGGLITGFAPSLAVFLLGRVVSGVGAAGVLSVAIILVIQLSPPKKRGLYTGILNTGFTIGVAFGAVAAGALQPLIGWRALFWVQTPLSMLAGAGLMLSIPPTLSANSTTKDQQQAPMLQRLAKVDYLGALLLVLSTVSLLLGLSTPKISWVPIITSILVLFPLFLAQEIYHHPDPIIPITVLQSRGALLSNLSTLGFMMSRWSVLFYTPIFASAVRGWSPATAGSILVPTNFGFAIGGLASGGIHIRRAGSWYVACLVIYALFPVTIFALGLSANKDTSTWIIIACTFCNGAVAGAALNYVLHHVLHLVVPEVRFIVTSLLATFRGFAGTFGSAIGGGIFVRVLRSHLETGFYEHGVGNKDLIRRLLGSPRAVQELSGVEKDVAVEAYTAAIQTLFFAGTGLSILMLFVQAGTGWKGPVTEEELEGSLTEEEEPYSDNV